MARLARVIGWTSAAAVALMCFAWWLARPINPGAFFTPTSQIPSAPGSLLRSEPFTLRVPVAAEAWRLLYTTSDAAGNPALASAIVVSPRASRGVPAPVIAWTHGTTGVVPGCGPSQLAEPFANLPQLDALIERGWILVATDYAGQGAAGRNPYLIGPGEAHSALDAIRAASALNAVSMDGRIVFWGHSQGGHAALWSGILAPDYAPELRVLGVAAMAPATDLRALVEHAQDTLIGRIMSAFILRAYSDHYSDVRNESYAKGWEGLMARDMAARCLAGKAALFSVAEAATVHGSLFATPPVNGPLGARLAENTPDKALVQPLLLAQGSDDDLVLPQVQREFVRARCADGQAIEFHEYAGRDHLSLVGDDSPLGELLLQWTTERLEGKPWSRACSETSHQVEATH